MARLIFAILVLAAAVVQALILPELLTVRIIPNLVLVLLLSWSAMRGLGEGAIWAFATGIVFDAMSLDPMGANALAFLAVCVLGTWAGRRFFQASIFLPIPITFVATWVFSLLVLIIRATETGGAPLSALGPLILLQALLNSFLVVLVYPVTRLLNRSVVHTR